MPAVQQAREWTSLLGGELDWNETYSPSERVDGRSIPIPRGRVVGGSSSINAMLWYRGHPDDYDAWEAAGATGWNHAAMLPFFKRSEDWMRGENEHRGVGGPMRIEVSPAPHPVAESLLTGAQEVGLPFIDDANAQSNEGACLANFNAVNVTSKPGAVTRLERWSAARGYLRPAARWSNLKVMTGTTVRQLILEAGVCVGVRCRTGGEDRELRASQGIVLASGALGTPRLLMLSGLGPPQQLREAGIVPKVDLPGVGANFQDHPLLRGMNFRMRQPLGPVRDNGGGAMLNWRSSQADHRPDLHVFVVQGVHAGPEVVRRYGIDPSDESICAISPGLMRSRSIGKIKLLSADGKMDIQPNYLEAPEDLSALVEGIDMVLDLAQTRSYRRILDGPLSPGGKLSRREAEQFIRMSCDTFFHCCGSAAMGTDDRAVVTPDLQVRGVENLWVADASVIPVIPTSNIQAPVIAVAERAAELIRGRLGNTADRPSLGSSL
ncbi:choline dehydrogenase [Nesterenkonia sandarakina]|uniref:Choline dehydrogenase n=2 Tax=Nesterenkonia sandarakina TaxID=272918 RepID=A0A2T0YIK7_9MICC|nr:choline dehydrogenase [Nesterenkonia sandarakina]